MPMKATAPLSLVKAHGSFNTELRGVIYDVRAGDVFESDHPLVAKMPDQFDAVAFRFPVKRSFQVEQATAAPGEKRGA